MGVMRERKTICEDAAVPSNPESTVQSGYTTQESEDEGSTSGGATTSTRPRRQRLIADGSLNLAFGRLITRHTGHRRARRILNTRFLETLSEDVGECDLDVRAVSKSKFQLLMEQTEDALDALEAYEREQLENTMNTRIAEDAADAVGEPYLKIPRKIRAAISCRKNFRYDLLKSIEQEVSSQCDGFVYTPATCYERLLVHAVAKYQGHHAETIVEDGRKVVRIHFNPPKTKTPTLSDVLLCDYIACLRAASEE